MVTDDILPDTTIEYQAPPKLDTKSEAESRLPPEGLSSIALGSQTEDVCVDCKKVHLPRRLVICHDGTWVPPDGTTESIKGNVSNVFRIWCMVKEGVVTDTDGKQWKQIRAPFIDGIGAVDRIIERIITTGEGPTDYEVKIRHIYKMCCKACPSSDEIFMFGYSRGAFVMRTVAGLLEHLQAIKPDLPDFDEQFLKSLRIYRAAQTKSQLLENSVFRDLSQNTRAGAKIKFLGFFDTIKAVNDSNLNDVELSENILHVRHAMALFEKCDQLSVERFLAPTPEADDKHEHSFQEAWFAGSHGNLGGACEEDGLALWPLQWILGEAEKYGLVLGFNQIPSSELEDPARLIFPTDTGGVREIDCANGLKVRMWSLSAIMRMKGFFPVVDGGRSSLFITTTSDRAIFSSGTGNLIGYDSTAPTGTYIHPSVFLLDETVGSMANVVNSLPYREALRSQVRFSIPNSEQNFWNIHKEINARKEIQLPRILVCGMTEVGKSTLINAVLGKKLTQESKGHQPGEHDIQIGFQSEDKDFIIHDSRGFEAGKESNYAAVQEFLKERRNQPSFREQVHCIWYCVSTDSRRIQESDRKFKDIDFGGVPVILVFTKSDRLQREIKSLALEEYQSENPGEDIEDISDVPDSDKAQIKEREKALYEEEMQRRRSEWHKEIPIFTNSIFISAKSKTSSSSIHQLLSASRESMTSERIARIHSHAQNTFIDHKLHSSIKKMVSLLLETRPRISFFNSDEKIEKLVTKAIQTTAEVFHYKDFNPDAYVPLIRNELFPPTPPQSMISSSWVTGGVATGAVLGLSLFLGPVGVLARAAIWAGGIAVAGVSNAQKLGLGLIMACLDVLLVMERLFWYTGGEIDELCVRAACLYYLRVRPKVLDRVLDKLGRNFLDREIGKGNWPNKKDLEELLREVVGEFRYKRRVDVSAENLASEGDEKEVSKDGSQLPDEILSVKEEKAVTEKQKDQEDEKEAFQEEPKLPVQIVSFKDEKVAVETVPSQNGVSLGLL